MAELADDWPSLAPIRTTCSTSSSSYEPSYSISSSGSYPFSLAPRSTEHHHYTFQSPPSSTSSSSHVMEFLHVSSSSTAKGGHGLLSKCLPPRPINATSKGFSRPCINGSPGGRLRQGVQGGRGGAAGAGAFRSYASFPGSQGLIYSTAVVVAASASSSSHSGPLHSNAACKNQLISLNAFTMIPANVVGKKKPPDYLSDEPTSPEVTCIGRVRRSKNSTCNWDALVNGSEKLCKKKKKPAALRKQIEFHHERRGSRDVDLQLAASIPRPICVDSSNAGVRIPKWRKIISLFKDIRDLHTPLIQRKLRQEDLIINLDQLRRAGCRAIASTHSNDNQIDNKDAESNAGSKGRFLQYLCQSDEEEREVADADQEEAGTDDCAMHGGAAPPTPPPNACLLLMRNKSGRSKVFHDDDGGNSHSANTDRGYVGAQSPSYPPALEASTAPNSAGHSSQRWNKKQAFSFWKSKKA